MTWPIRTKALIRTERLALRPYAPQDLGSLMELLTDPRITKTFMVPALESPEQMERLARRMIAFSQPDDAEHLEYGVFREGKLIGFVNDCGIEGDGIEIGYVIHPDEQGRGYATEAVRAVLTELREMGFRRVTAGFFEENAASRRVMEKCGMRLTDRRDEEEYRGERHACRYCEIDLREGGTQPGASPQAQANS